MKFLTSLCAMLVVTGTLMAQVPQTPKVSAPLQHMQDIKTAPDGAWIQPPMEEALMERLAARSRRSPETPGGLRMNTNTPPTRGLEKVLSGAIDGKSVFFDAPGDGSIWARTGHFKVRFSRQNMTVIPYLGAQAPGNEPVACALQEVSLDGHPLSFSRNVAPSRQGRQVIQDRGLLKEIYQVDAEGIEQTFVVQNLPNKGDLDLHLGITTQLGVRMEAGKIDFFSNRGGIHYGQATAIGADGTHLALATHFDHASITIHVPASFVMTAAFPLVIDPRISFFNINPGSQVDINPDVAYDVTSDTYFVCWERAFSNTDHDVYSVRLDAAGNMIPGSGDYIDFTTDYWSNPRCASNNLADQVLVVAQVGIPVPAPGSSNRVIKGRMVAIPSGGAGNQFQISGPEIGDKTNPDVGGDPSLAPPTYYCVTWMRHFAAADWDIHARLVTTTGSLAGTSTIFLDNSAATADILPRISKADGQPPFSSQGWSIVWERFGFIDINVRGAQIHWDGTVTIPPFDVDASSNVDSNPTVSSPTDLSAGRRTLVVFERGSQSGNTVLWGVALNGANLVTDNNLSTLAGIGPRLFGQRPAVDSDGCRFGVAYNNDDNDARIASFTLDAGDNLIATEGETLGVGLVPGLNPIHPAITSRHSGGAGSDSLFLGVADEMGIAPSLGTLWNTIAGFLYEAPPLAVTSLPTGCGGLILLESESNQGLNHVFSLNLQNTATSPILIVGYPLVPVLPLCGPCKLGVQITGPAPFPLIFAQTSLSFSVPCDPALVGLTIAVQGADGLFLPCGLGLRVSNTLLITFQ